MNDDVREPDQDPASVAAPEDNVSSDAASDTAEDTAEDEANKGFKVRLTNFEGPFDLLLQLIFAHRLDVTEVALHQVTDDFIAYTKEIGRAHV